MYHKMLVPLPRLLIFILAIVGLLLCDCITEARKGLGETCTTRRRARSSRKCSSIYDCKKSPVIRRCVPNRNTYSAGSRGIDQSCYDSTDCKAHPSDPNIRVKCEQDGGLANRLYKRKCKPYLYVVNADRKSHGDVFKCLPNVVAYGAVVIKADSSGYATPGTKYVAVFDVRSGNNDQTMCAIVEDLDCAWIPSDGGRGGRGYATQCLGMCGAQCGKNGDGLFDKRYKTLIVHDVCQAWIGSTESIGNGGLTNACGDEALHGTSAAMAERRKKSSNRCEDGDFLEDLEEQIGRQCIFGT